MKFYRLDPQSGNRIKVYPETLVTIEIVSQDKNQKSLVKVLSDLATTLESLDLSLVDTTQRIYLNDQGITIVYTKKEFSSTK
jgi:hypothetical protein